MKIEEFLGRLDGVQQSGGGFVARCPAHDDDNPSMSVTPGDGGRILVHCHAGCPAESIVGALGLKMSDLMPEDPNYRSARKRRSAPPAITPEAIVKPSFEARKKRPSKHVCYYDYQDESGATVFRVDRREYTDDKGGKTFIQMHPTASGGWDFGVSKAGVKRVPFRLPKIIEAAREHRNVVICEGEKDVLTVERTLGMTATCNPGGAGKWEPGWGRYFEGCPSVLIVADKDPLEKEDRKTGEMKTFAVGQRHACSVKRMLEADGYTGRIVRIVMPDVDGEKVKDFTDWAEAMTRHGHELVRSALTDIVGEFGEWPSGWEFDEADLIELQRAGKAARNTSSSTAVEKSAGVRIGAAGRFGSPVPRSPSEDGRKYLVDYQIKAGKVARFIVGVGSIAFEGWERGDADEGDQELEGKDGGQYRRMKHFTEMRCALPDYMALAVGSMMAWDESFKMPNADRIALVSLFALVWLRARGQFFADKNNPCYDTSLFFDDSKGILYRLHSNEFQSFLATVSNVNREDKTFKFMMSLIDDFAMDDGYTPRVIPSKEWDRSKDGKSIYISNGDSRICRIRAGKIEDVPNGTDGVVFVRGATLEPWKLQDGEGSDPFSTSMLFQNASLEKESDRMNCRLWFMNLFACHTNKPILLVTGPARSGKTRLLQGMKQFLGIREDGKMDDTVTSIDPTDKGLDAFWIIVDRGRFEIFDNYDQKIKWAENELQTAATNGSVKRRELYKTSNLVTLSANSYIGLTSNNPIFTTEGGGLPDRIITVRVGSGRKVSLGGELLKDILAHRDEYMTWIVRVLAKVLADEQPVDESINRRHPDYGIFSTKVGRAVGDEAGAIKSMEAAELEKALLPLQNDTIAKEVLSVLLDKDPKGSMRFTASDMSEAIINRLGDDETDEKTRTIYGARRIGKSISKLNREFSTLFKWSSRMLEGRTIYEFVGLTAHGEVALGGFGGFNNAISENSLQGAHAREDFSQNASNNPPNPPYARAQAPDTFSPREEDDNRKDTETDDGGDGWGFDL